MNEIHFARRWWPLLLFAILIVPGMLAYSAPLGPYFVASAEGLPRPKVAWDVVIAGDIVLLVLGLGIYWNMLSSLLAKFTEEGIRQPALFRWKFIRWSEVRRIEDQITFVKVSSSSERIELNILFFKEEQRVIDELRKRLAPDYGGP